MFSEFLKAIIQHWVNWASGLVGVLLWIGGFVADSRGWSNWSRGSFWGGGTLALLFSFYSVWREERKAVLAFQKRFEGLPRICLAEQGFHADEFYTLFVTSKGEGRQPVGPPYSVLRLRVKNDPESSTPESVARELRADIAFFSEGGQKLLEMDGRWSDSPQPFQQNASVGVVSYLSVDFAIGQARNLDIVTKCMQQEECCGVNNDSFNHMHLQNPKLLLPAGVIHCHVRLRGGYVDETFRMVFRSGVGPLEVISAEQQRK